MKTFVGIILILSALLGVILFFYTCSSQGNSTTAPAEPKVELPGHVSSYEGLSGGLYLYTIDGCEYLVYAYGEAGGIVHKANCPNPSHESAGVNPVPVKSHSCSYVGLTGSSYLYTVDGCDYVVYAYGSAGGITHAGNCKNHKK